MENFAALSCVLNLAYTGPTPVYPLHAMRHLIFTILSLLSFAYCRPEAPEEVPLPTKICIKTQHHHQPIPKAAVYIKYNAVAFEGYDRPPSYYDKTFLTGPDAKACIAPVPEGRHLLVAFGYDSLYFPHHVYGSMWLDISLGRRPVADTILYVSE